MSQQVLARKWRPRSFQEMVGQTLVIRALSNALNQNRLHHAYLFTGTRGVGKTSLARLVAKCLNCEQGVSATPCEQCTACQSINQGRFLDLLEIDAASRTKVEDTRDLLDNVQYAPTHGRYKIYLIDEVHMLSNHSFNALLKTLEEPPAHVKFLLATTDPQRLPVTVLSRCLQFHLKNLPAEQISGQLAHILDHEQIGYEKAALPFIAQAAQGSMRDALSLLDQAIAFSNGQLQTQDVKTMLGKTEPELLLALIRALIEHQPQQLVNLINELAEAGVDFSTALEELLTLLHQVSLQQLVPTLDQEESITTLASQINQQDVQLYYQIALIGRRDLTLAPTPRIGFEMILLRMLAFRPQSVDLKASPHTKPTPSPSPPKPTPVPAKPNSQETSWEQLLNQLNLHGAALAVASHCALEQQTADAIHLVLDAQHAPLLNKAIEQRMANALNEHFNKPMELHLKILQSSQLRTPATIDEAKQQQRQSQAIQSITNDNHVKALMDQFNARLLPDSIKSKDNNV